MLRIVVRWRLAPRETQTVAQAQLGKQLVKVEHSAAGHLVATARSALTTTHSPSGERTESNAPRARLRAPDCGGTAGLFRLCFVEKEFPHEHRRSAGSASRTGSHTTTEPRRPPAHQVDLRRLLPDGEPAVGS
jgi:hypothetical protein